MSTLNRLVIHLSLYFFSQDELNDLVPNLKLSKKSAEMNNNSFEERTFWPLEQRLPGTDVEKDNFHPTLYNKNSNLLCAVLVYCLCLMS